MSTLQIYIPHEDTTIAVGDDVEIYWKGNRSTHRGVISRFERCISACKDCETHATVFTECGTMENYCLNKAIDGITIHSKNPINKVVVI